MQTNLLNEAVLSPAELEELRLQDETIEYITEEVMRPDYNHMQKQCETIIEKYPDSPAGRKCQKVNGMWKPKKQPGSAHFIFRALQIRHGSHGRMANCYFCIDFYSHLDSIL